MSLFKETPEDYLELVKDWEDPWPDPIIEMHDGEITASNRQDKKKGAQIEVTLPMRS